jgi:hypothetical protein
MLGSWVADSLYHVAFNKLFVIPEGVIGNLGFKAGSPIQAFGDDTSFDCNLVLIRVFARCSCLLSRGLYRCLMFFFDKNQYLFYNFALMYHIRRPNLMCNLFCKVQSKSIDLHVHSAALRRCAYEYIMINPILPASNACRSNLSFS